MRKPDFIEVVLTGGIVFCVASATLVTALAVSNICFPRPLPTEYLGVLVDVDPIETSGLLDEGNYFLMTFNDGRIVRASFKTGDSSAPYLDSPLILNREYGLQGGRIILWSDRY